MNAPQCDMTATCPFPVKMIDKSGFIYCKTHGTNQRDYGYRTRLMRPWELRLIEQGKPLPSYKPISKAEALARA